MERGGTALESLCLIPVDFFFNMTIIITLQWPFQPVLTLALAPNWKEKLNDNKRPLL